MMTRTSRATRVTTFAWLAAGMACRPAIAHDGAGTDSVLRPPPPAALVQVEYAREATARYLDVDQAERDGYVDIGVFVPNMGWHYLKQSLLDDTFDVGHPELLVYADDPCGGKRRLVAVEYAVPLAEARYAPSGFVGRSDTWDVNAEFGLWTLHAWIWEYNPAGIFASLNQRVAVQ